MAGRDSASAIPSLPIGSVRRSGAGCVGPFPQRRCLALSRCAAARSWRGGGWRGLAALAVRAEGVTPHGSRPRQAEASDTARGGATQCHAPGGRAPARGARIGVTRIVTPGQSAGIHSSGQIALRLVLAGRARLGRGREKLVRLRMATLYEPRAATPGYAAVRDEVSDEVRYCTARSRLAEAPPTFLRPRAHCDTPLLTLVAARARGKFSRILTEPFNFRFRPVLSRNAVTHVVLPEPRRISCKARPIDCR